MRFRQLAIYFFTLLSIDFVYSGIGNRDACSERLERALDALHRDSTRRNKLGEEEAGTLYQRKLRSAPLEISVSRMAVKLPESTKESGGQWARVERCVYESDRNSLRTRVVFNDLSMSATVSLLPRDIHALILAESCRMTLRLRRAGIDFHTSPIARGRGQMRIRTESSFLQPRFASIYAYGCHLTRVDKPIKRQDKWPPYYATNNDKITPLSLPTNDKYEEAEPRQLAGIAEEVEDVVIPNESRHPRYSHAPEINFGVWRKNSWITKSSLRRKRSTTRSRYARNTTIKLSQDAADAPATNEPVSTDMPANIVDIFNLTDSLRDLDLSQNVSREVRELLADDNFDNLFSIDSEDLSRSWQSRESVTREMEDMFLQGAGQALTKYIERQLHPAIKETLMLSMGYTISYG